MGETLAYYLQLTLLHDLLYCTVALFAPIKFKEIDMPIKKILAPIDFSEPSKKAIVQAKELLGFSGGELVLLFVEESFLDPQLPESMQKVMEDYSQNMHQHAEKLMKELVDEHLKEVNTTFLIRAGHPVETILSTARDQKVDMICMATQGWSNNQSAGSVTERVVRGSSIPILVLPNPGKIQEIERPRGAE